MSACVGVLLLGGILLQASKYTVGANCMRDGAGRGQEVVKLPTLLNLIGLLYPPQSSVS